MSAVNKISGSLFFGLCLVLQTLIFGCLTFYFSLITAYFFALLIAITIFIFFAYNNRLYYKVSEFLVACTLLLIYLFRINLEGTIHGWDARSIWLFHTKIIFLFDGIHGDMGWTYPTIDWSHPDYPILGPLLGAFCARLHGSWNEEVTRFSWFFLLLPTFFIASSFIVSRWSAICCFFIYLSLSSWLWQGSMDGYLALYSFLATILFSRWLIEEKRVDFVVGVLALGVIVSLKNEGALIALSLAISIFTLARKKLSFKLTTYSALVAALLFLHWSVYKKYYGIVSDLKVGSGEFILRAWSRLIDLSSNITIFKFMFSVMKGGYYLIFLFFISYFFWKKSSNYNKDIARVSGFILLTALCYWFGLYLVYLGTPYPFEWHLATSIDRVLLSFNFIILGGLFFYPVRANFNNVK